MKYIVREGKVRGEGRYLVDSVGWIGSHHGATRYDRAAADWCCRDLRKEGKPARVVRLLTHEESKRKAAAEALRAAAMFAPCLTRGDLERRADCLWPTKAARGGERP